MKPSKLWGHSLCRRPRNPRLSRGPSPRSPRAPRSARASWDYCAISRMRPGGKEEDFGFSWGSIRCHFGIFYNFWDKKRHVSWIMCDMDPLVMKLGNCTLHHFCWFIPEICCLICQNISCLHPLFLGSSSSVLFLYIVLQCILYNFIDFYSYIN